MITLEHRVTWSGDVGEVTSPGVKIPPLASRFRATVIAASALTIIACARDADSPDVADQDWKRGAVCYEIFVRSFADSDGNGIGDFNGLTAKLDYVNDGNPDTQTAHGASCLWLRPGAQSPS